MVQAELGPSENEPESVETDSNLPAEEKERGALSKEAQLQDDENQGEILGEKQGEVLGQQRYVPTHRKAFSLPRTLEVKKCQKKLLFHPSFVGSFCQWWHLTSRRGRNTCVPHSQRKHCHIEVLVCTSKDDFMKLRF